MNFPSYDHNQLIAIVNSRLQGSDIFDFDSIEWCARKVGAVSGDVRKALEICRYLLILTNSRSLQIAKTRKLRQVTIDIVKEVIKVLLN